MSKSKSKSKSKLKERKRKIYFKRKIEKSRRSSNKPSKFVDVHKECAINDVFYENQEFETVESEISYSYNRAYETVSNNVLIHGTKCSCCGLYICDFAEEQLQKSAYSLLKTNNFYY